MIDAKKIWSDALEILSTQISLVAMEIWIQPLEAYAVRENTLVLLAPLKNAKKRVQSEYSDAIRNALCDVNTFVTDFEVICDDEKEDYEDGIKREAEAEREDSRKKALFNPQFTFDNFVIGNSNQIAYAAAKAVAENPGKAHNPLFIYGGVGLGKTHIMHAIGNYILQNNPESDILYVTTEQFVNDFIDSIRNNKDNDNKKFREKYRNVDVLMLDDIQFIAGKQSTQEALFHTFNDLYHFEKQIILSSDRHPKELTFLDERLQSRFQYGLTCDITAPDVETRIAILQKKAYAKKYVVSPEVIYFIAEKIDSNIRELEGALNKVMFYSSLVGKEADSTDVVLEALKDDIDVNNHVLSIDTIVDKVCSYYNVSKKDIVGKKRNSAVAEPRHVCIYLINDILSLPLVTIGEYFGGRDHTTIIHARDKISALVTTDNKIKTDVKNLKDMIMRN